MEGHAVPYIDDNLSPDERVRYRAKVHWSIFIRPAVFLVVGFSLMFSELPGLGVLIVAISLYIIVSRFIYAKATEFSLTNKRVVAKTGLMRRSTIEQRLEMVDNIRIHQGLLERLFNAGSVRVTGSGASQTPIVGIEDPLKFRREVNDAIESIKARV